MTTAFKTPQDVINACNVECERAWNEYLKINNIDPVLAPEAVAAAKQVFNDGYYAGARWVSGTIVQNLINSNKLNIPQT
jgi:hypothetical protein